MASSSTSTNGSSSYDVFLNFMGEDTCNHFASFLHEALKDTGINVCFDSEILWTGKAIGPTLRRSIEGSKISIPIFSKGYAKSKWCLWELAQIVQCHTSNNQVVLPIFFKVNPSHVRSQIGSFEEAFQEHETKFEPDMVKSWRNALKVVGNLKGQALDLTTDQTELVELVVKRVLGELIRSTHLAESKFLIGIDSPINDLESLLNIDSDNVQVLGICGLGGIGKTTIAKVVYNRILSTFNKHSFLSDIRERAAQHMGMGLVSLQKQLLKDMFQEDIDIANDDMEKTLIEQGLSKEKVLIVLDDVNSEKQINALAGEIFKWFGPGSRVIITTRDEDILALANDVYKPQVLDHEQSLQLFSWHAFQKDQVPEDYMQLSHDVAYYSGGLPLTLKVLGSYLSNKSNKKVWESTLQTLKEIPHEEVQRRLRISYDNLENDYQKALFLDAACFFIGSEKETVISILEACGYQAEACLYTLIKRSLLKFGGEYEGDSSLQMHDQIRDMGREIVVEKSRMELGEHSRLWSYDGILEVLEGNKGTSKIEGISLPYVSPLVKLDIEPFKMMVNLRFLEINSKAYKGNFSDLPSALRCFMWTGCSWYKAPTNFYHKRLVYLDISKSKFKEVWNISPSDKNKRFQNLKVLDMNRCDNLYKSPNFSWFPYLERLDLRLCNSLEKLDKSIGQLSKLKSLILMGCGSLKKLPESIGGLTSLVEFDLSDCDKLEELPDAVGLLEKLEILNAENCCKLMKLPRSMQKMRCLHSIKLERTRISNIPEDFSMLLNLVELEISCRLESFPDLSHLKMLKQLTLYRCKKLEYLGELPSSLIQLCCEECDSLVELSDLSRLRNLRKLSLRGCTSLDEIRGLEGTESLEELDARECFELTCTPRKAHGWGTLIADRPLGYSYSLTATDGMDNDKGLVLCLVFQVMSSVFSWESVDFHISASIRQKDQTIWCLHTLRIEEVEFDRHPHRDVIYIHHFNGFDWFGIPMEGKDAIEIHDIHGLGESYNLQFWKLLFENMEQKKEIASPSDKEEEEEEEETEDDESPSDSTEEDDEEPSSSEEEEDEEEELLRPGSAYGPPVPRPGGIFLEILDLKIKRNLDEFIPKQVENRSHSLLQMRCSYPLIDQAMLSVNERGILEDEDLLMDIGKFILDEDDEVNVSFPPLPSPPVEEALLMDTERLLILDKDEVISLAPPRPPVEEALLMDTERLLILDKDEVISLPPPVDEVLLRATVTPLIVDEVEAMDDDEALLRTIGRIVVENEEDEILKAMERLPL